MNHPPRICTECGFPVGSSACTCSMTFNRCPVCKQELTSGGCGCNPYEKPWEEPPYTPPPLPIGHIGWRCPVCGAGNAPDIQQCPCTHRYTTDNKTTLR